MLIKCNKIISPVTKEDLGDVSPWLKKGKIYTVFALYFRSKLGVEACIQTEHYNEPRFITLNGFEIISQKIPSSWITTVKNLGDEIIITMLPKNWAYDNFFSELEDENPDAVTLYSKEAEMICLEETSN